jgi:hypothetical protein
VPSLGAVPNFTFSMEPIMPMIMAEVMPFFRL